MNYKRQANLKYMTSQLTVNAVLTLVFKYHMLEIDYFEVRCDVIH